MNFEHFWMFQFQWAHIFQPRDLWCCIIFVNNTCICFGLFARSYLLCASGCFCRDTASWWTLAAVWNIHTKIQCIFDFVWFWHSRSTANYLIVGIQLNRNLESCIITSLLYRIILASTGFKINPLATVKSYISPCLSVLYTDLITGDIQPVCTGSAWPWKRKGIWTIFTIF